MESVTAALVDRPAHEILVDQFMKLDAECQELIEKFTSGRILYECIPAAVTPSMGDLIAAMITKFISFQEYLKSLIEKRNAKLQEAQIALRGTVMIPEGAHRGVDGKATTNRYGPFEVSSNTSRFFIADKLLTEVQKRGLFQRLLDLKTADKETGDPIPVVSQEWKIDFGPTKNWLRENNLEAVIQEAYDEKESTPAVKGPKPIGWLGSKQEK